MKTRLAFILSSSLLFSGISSADGMDYAEKEELIKSDSKKKSDLVSEVASHPAAKDYSTYRYQRSRNESRYETSQGWSRAPGFRGSWWFGNGRGGQSDIPTSGYTAPPNRK